jgi:adenylate cyclase
MSDVFISYARATEARARQIAAALRALGYGVWRDDELPAHRAYGDVIQEQLRVAKAVVVIWSSEAASSEWVRSEAERARIERKLVQLTVDGAELPMPFDQTQCPDLTHWDGEPDAPGWRKVLASIAELTERGASSAAGPAPTRLQAKRRREKPSICVLPFANMSGDAEQEYFSDGISEDIITDLSKVSALAVASRNTAFSYKGKAINVGDVARALSVSHVLEGSVRKAGNRVRITGQLIEGASDSHIWAERYDRELDDIFALQDEISHAIVAALKLKLLPEEKSAIARRGTTDVEAYDLFLMARRYLQTGNQGDPRRDEAIIRLCHRAISIDPGYARAWSLLALAQSVLFYAHNRGGDNGLAAAERALRLDPELAEPHAIRAKILHAEGRNDEAFAEIDVALRLDPESWEANARAGQLHLRDRRFDLAIRYLSKATSLADGDFASPGMQITAYLALGDTQGAFRVARTVLERVENVMTQDSSNGNAMSWAALALATLGDAGAANAWMHRALAVDPDNWVMRYNFACAMVGLKEFDAAIHLLRPVIEVSPGWALRLAETDPDFDTIREDPRFVAILAEAKARIMSAAEPAASPEV